MATMALITVGQMKEMLEQYDDDLGLDFGDYEFQRLSLNNENLVNVELKLVADHEAGFMNTQED